MDQTDYCQDRSASSPEEFRHQLSVERGALQRGVAVYMAGRNPEKVAKAVVQFAAHGDRVRTLVADVTKRLQQSYSSPAYIW